MPYLLTPNFTLEELTLSQTAARRGLDNTPDAVALKNLERLARTLEQVRELLGGKPVNINSGFRAPAVNRAVGGSSKSAHVNGLAVDFTVTHFGSVLETAHAIRGSSIAYDQLIFEFGHWVHLGLASDETLARRQDLSIMVAGRYVSGITNMA